MHGSVQRCADGLVDVNRWRILIVDDDATIAEQTAESLRMTAVSTGGDLAEVDSETSFDRALELLRQRHFDLLVLDVRDQSRTGQPQVGPDATGTEVTDADLGLRVFKQVRESRFVPIVFFTALPQLVRGEDIAGTPFVAVVSKNAEDGMGDLRASVRAVFDSTLPAIHRALLDHVDQIVREFMAEFVQRHWADLSSPSRKGDLAHLLLRRLALSLGEGGEVLSERLAGESVDLTPDSVHPMRYYIVPPVGSWTTGDLITGPRIVPAAVPSPTNPSPPNQDSMTAPASPATSGTTSTWYVVLTPACDLVEAHLKAEYVVLVECVPLIDTPECKTFLDSRPSPGEEPSSQAKSAERRLRRLMQNDPEGRPKDRNFYLPAAWAVPNLVVDFQRVVYVPYGELTQYERVATLDSPYAEAIVAKFGRYLGRLGTPDLDIDVPLNRLRQS